MKIALLINAHKNPDQVSKLIKCFDHPNYEIFLIFSKSSELTNINQSNLHIVDFPKKIARGHISQIKAAMHMLKIAHKSNFDRYALISGQDLPIKSPDQILKFFEENKETEFVEIHQLPREDWYQGGMERIWFYWPDESSNKIKMSMRNVYLKLQRFLRVRRNTDLTFYGSSNWFNLTNSAVTRMIDYLEKNPHFYNRFEMTYCADELFFNTLLKLSYPEAKIVSDNLRWTYWEPGAGSPNVITLKDFDSLFENNIKLFARKFDSDIDKDVIDRVAGLYCPER